MSRAPYLALALAWATLPREQATRLRTVPRIVRMLQWSSPQAADLIARETAWLDWNPRDEPRAGVEPIS